MVDTIETERLVLRALRPADAGAMTLYSSDPRVARMTTSIPHPYPPGAAEAFIERAARNPREEVRAIDASPIGAGDLVGVIVFRPAGAEIGYWVGPPFWNTGYATEAVAGLARHLFARRGVERLTASVFADNPASIHVLEKAGFAPDGETTQHSVARGESAPTLRFALARPAARAAE